MNSNSQDRMRPRQRNDDQPTAETLLGTYRACTQTMTLSELMELFLAKKSGEIAPSAVYNYSLTLRRIEREAPQLSSIPIGMLDESQIRRFEDSQLQKGTSPNTVRRSHSLMKSALSMAVEAGAIPRNPAMQVNPPRKRASPPPSAEESARIEQVARLMQGRVGLAANLAIDAQARCCQVAALRWRDLEDDFSGGFIHSKVSRDRRESKSYLAPRRFEISDPTKIRLEIHRARLGKRKDAIQDDLIFDVIPSVLSREFNQTAKVFGINCRFSTLRLLKGGQ